MIGSRRKVLFFSEAVTIAHLIRPLVLANSLDSERIEVHFATAKIPDNLLAETKNFVLHKLQSSLDPAEFQKAMFRTGQMPFSPELLHQSYLEDLALIRNIQPDLVVGDFRLSLRASTRHAQVPYISLTNFYWHLQSGLKGEVPETLFTHIFGVRFSQWFFRLFESLIFKLAAIPLNRFRKRIGVDPLQEVRQAFTDGDLNVYADLESMYAPSKEDTDEFLGPILFSLKSENLPRPTDRKKIVVTLGSSGNYLVLEPILRGLEGLDFSVVVVAAPENLQKDFQKKDQFQFLPFTDIDALMKGAALVICNGGSPSTSLAMNNGVPVLGIASNMDQQLNMRVIESQKLGIRLRSEHVSARQIRDHVEKILKAPEYTSNAITWQKMMTGADAKKSFSDMVNAILIPRKIARMDEIKISRALYVRGKREKN